MLLTSMNSIQKVLPLGPFLFELKKILSNLLERISFLPKKNKK
jgi:hypothetical protein